MNLGISRIGYDWATYVVMMLAAIWTISVVPTAYLLERFGRRRLSETNLRRLLVASCAAVGYLSTFLFAAPIAITPFGFAFAAGGAVYGAIFKTAAKMLQTRG
jgi:MFS family permease